MKSAFIVNLSRGDKIKIDEDEIPKLIDGIKKGQIIVFRQGIVNPSFFVSVVEDTKRILKVIDEIRGYKQRLEWYPERKEEKPKIDFLRDIFEEIKNKKLLQ